MENNPLTLNENKSMLAKLYQSRLHQNSMAYNEDAVKLTLPVSERDHIQGPNTAPVTLVEYGDYECPYCAQAYLIIKEVQERLGTKLRFVFRNFPFTSAHPRAYRVALGAEAQLSRTSFGICTTIYLDMGRQILMKICKNLQQAWVCKLTNPIVTLMNKLTKFTSTKI